MKGTSWLRTIAKENLHFQTAVQSLSADFKSIEAEFKKATNESSLKDIFECDSIYITPTGTYSYEWRWKDQTTLRNAAAVCCRGDTVWAVEEDKEGREIYTLSCYTKKGCVWHSNTSIGPFICVSENYCYVLEATSELRYGVCASLDATTGRDRRVIYKEKSLRNNLSLLCCEGCVFLLSNNSGHQALYHIEGVSIKRIGEECVSFVPVGYGKSKPCFFGRIGSYASPWTAFGEELCKYSIPKALREYGLDFFSLSHSLLITSAGGIRTVYRCHPGKSPEKINKVLGTIFPDVFGKSSVYIARVPGSTPSVYDMNKCTVEGKKYASATLQTTKSLDGTVVPYVLVKPKVVKGLLVNIYGAYGLPTKLDTCRWKPYLESGWAIAFGLIRGGGDFGDAWADAARTSHKGRSIEDTEAVIRDAQKQTGVSWKATCIYGRSAGGYTLGAIVAHHGVRGGLIGAAYAEVPYVDILRTTTNPLLPLTALEYDEFGNPREKLEDLETILRLSPVDALPEEGAPAIFVVARTSVNDREVFPYETVKWITKLRGFPTQTGGAEKYLFIGDKQGHFSRGSRGDRQKAEDFLLLRSWLSSCPRV